MCCCEAFDTWWFTSAYELGCCRNFRRAAAVGGELETDVVDKLLEVLSAGAHPWFTTLSTLLHTSAHPS